jgi:hypothetical protein
MNLDLFGDAYMKCDESCGMKVANRLNGKPSMWMWYGPSRSTEGWTGPICSRLLRAVKLCDISWTGNKRPRMHV